jgi:hypothetical protein
LLAWAAPTPITTKPPSMLAWWPGEVSQPFITACGV